MATVANIHFMVTVMRPIIRLQLNKAERMLEEQKASHDALTDEDKESAAAESWYEAIELLSDLQVDLEQCIITMDDLAKKSST